MRACRAAAVRLRSGRDTRIAPWRSFFLRPNSQKKQLTAPLAPITLRVAESLQTASRLYVGGQDCSIPKENVKIACPTAGIVLRLRQRKATLGPVSRQVRPKSAEHRGGEMKISSAALLAAAGLVALAISPADAFGSGYGGQAFKAGGSSEPVPACRRRASTCSTRYSPTRRT